VTNTPPRPAEDSTREVLDLATAADFLGIKTRTLAELVRNGNVPAAKVGRQWRFLRSQLTDWLAQGGTDQPNREAA
jgi:excisionase family DNA binding protein